MIDWLTDTLLATTALLLLVLVIRRPVACHFGAGMAYALWLLPAARLLMPSLERTVPAIQDGNSEVTTLPLMVRESVPADAVVNLADAPAIDWVQLLIAVWLGGAALLFIVQMVRYCVMRDELLADATEIERVGSIRVVQSDLVAGPLAFGLFARFVAVPLHFTSTFAPRERDLALAHEFAHHRSGDLYANLVAFIVLCLNWFNPVAWLAWSAFRLDQEAACDARVLAGCDASTRESYGRALARTAIDQRSPFAPTFATALNHPRTIIERLRRMMMNDTSKRRRIFGRLGLLGATAIALPLTATVVPVFAKKADEPTTTEKPTAEVRKHKIVMIKKGDGDAPDIDTSGDAETPFVKKIEKDGKTIVLRSNKELSEAEVEKMVAEAEESRADAEASNGEGASEGVAFRINKDGRLVEADGVDFLHVAVDSFEFERMIPEMEISEVRGKCDEGRPVTTDVDGFDGQKKSRIRIVVCGKGQAKLARAEAINGLKEALSEIRDEEDIPKNIRKDVLKRLQQQIERLEKQSAKDSDG